MANGTNKYHQNSLRKARIYNSKNPYFVTICTYNKQAILVKDGVASVLIGSIKFCIDESRIICLGFVIMPDHMHWAFALRETYTLDSIISRHKSFTARKAKNFLCDESKIWQDGYYDHYMHNNPVRKGMVDVPEKYLYSTANERYAGMIDWGYLGY